MKDYMLGQRQKNYTKFWRVFVVLILVLIVGAAVAVRVVYNQALGPVSASQHNVLVTIPTGATISEIGKTLKEAGLIREKWAFEWYIRNSTARDKLQAGTYYLRPNQGVKGVVEALTQGRIATNLFTILPGQRLDQIRSALITNGGFSESEVDAALNPENYSSHQALADKPGGASLEGYLYPESFQKNAETKPSTLVKQSLDEMQKRLTPDIKQAISNQGLDLHEGIVLASIVEREASDSEDRKTIAQVFLSRLRSGMLLQSDPTSVYGAIKAGQSSLSISASIAFDSPYNTYKHNGLPPGPISNISESSLKAVAYPSTTDYLYFVSGDDGKTYFSHTKTEHERLVEQYCKKLCNQ